MSHTETGYGFYTGGDPNLFYPDPESCTQAEIDAHAAACKAWDAGSRPDDPRGYGCWNSPFGVGAYAFACDCDEWADDPDDPDAAVPA